MPNESKEQQYSWLRNYTLLCYDEELDLQRSKTNLHMYYTSKYALKAKDCHEILRIDVSFCCKEEVPLVLEARVPCIHIVRTNSFREEKWRPVSHPRWSSLHSKTASLTLVGSWSLDRKLLRTVRCQGPDRVCIHVSPEVPAPCRRQALKINKGQCRQAAPIRHSRHFGTKTCCCGQVAWEYVGGTNQALWSWIVRHRHV
jgi:hypothetical protein